MLSRESHPRAATATCCGYSTHTEPAPANRSLSQRNGDTFCEQCQHRSQGIVPATLWAGQLAQQGPACPGLLSSCHRVLFDFFFFFSLSWKLIVHFQQQQGDPGDNSAATRPGTSTTWTRFRHLASHKEGGKQRGSIPSAPEANKLHRLTPAAAETCRNDLGFSKAYRDKLLHVFSSP